MWLMQVMHNNNNNNKNYALMQVMHNIFYICAFFRLSKKIMLLMQVMLKQQ